MYLTCGFVISFYLSSTPADGTVASCFQEANTDATYQKLRRLLCDPPARINAYITLLLKEYWLI